MTVGAMCFIYSYLDSRGCFAYPLYDENKKEADQICNFFVQNQGDSLSSEEFQMFWSHVQVIHEHDYLNIPEMYRSKMADISRMIQVSCLLLKTYIKGNCRERIRMYCSLTSSSIHCSLSRYRSNDKLLLF